MPHLVVILGRTDVPLGKELRLPDMAKRLSFHLEDEDPNIYYSYILEREGENGGSPTVHYAKANVKEVGTGDLVIRWTPITQEGRYHVAAYAQNGLLKGVALKKVASGSYGQLVASSSFRVVERGSSRFMDPQMEEKDRKYCSCIVQVAASQSNECLKTRKWGDLLGVPPTRCADPFEVCAKNLKRPSEGCYNRMLLEEMTSNELVGFALAEEIPLPSHLENRSMGAIDRLELINVIKAYHK